MGGFERTRGMNTMGITPQPVPPAMQETMLEPRLNRTTAQSIGFTGDQCGVCNSMRMVHTGHCNTCQECGTTTGCS